MQVGWIFSLCSAAGILLGSLQLVWATADNVIRLGVVIDEPFAFFDEQNFLRGIYIEFIEEIASLQKWDIKYLPSTLESGLENLYAGKIDLLIGIPKEYNLATDLDFSTYSFTVIWEQVYALPNHELQTILDLQNKKLAITQHEFPFSQIPQLCKQLQLGCEVVRADSPHQVFTWVAEGKVEAGIVNNVFGSRYSSRYGLERTPLWFDPQPLRLAAVKGVNPALVAVYDVYLREWQQEKNSFGQAILSRWSKSVAHSANNPALSFFHSLSLWQKRTLVSAIVLTVILLWLVSLRWHIKRRTLSLSEKLQKTQRSERQYQLLVESVSYGLQEIDLKGKILFGNIAQHQICRYAVGELLGKSILEITVSPEEKERLKNYLDYLAKEQPPPISYYSSILRKDGVVAEVRMEWNYKRGDSGKVIGFFILTTDITQMQRTKEKILKNHHNLKKIADERSADLIEAYNELLITATVFENTSEGILVIDKNGYIHTINPAFTRITGYEEREIIGKPLATLGSEKVPRFYEQIWENLEQETKWQGEVWNKRANGQIYPAWLSISVVLNAEEEVMQYVALLSDITKRKEYEKQIWQQANYDGLTGLPNRHLFHRRLEQAINYTHQKEQSGALMFVDLDKFKEVNDSMGHDAGDELLRVVAQRFMLCVRKNDTVARMGGDEFTVILPLIKNIEEVEEVAAHILKQLNQPFTIREQAVCISGSIGIVLYPQDGIDTNTLLKNADIAMYRAKEKSRNDYCFYRNPP